MKGLVATVCGLALVSVTSCGASDKRLAPDSGHALVPPQLVSDRQHWVNHDGKVKIEQLHGKVVWLQFNFFEHCTPMRPHLVRWHQQYADRGLVIVEIDGGKHESLHSTRSSVEAKDIEHLVLWDKGNQNHQRFGIHTWPRAFLIGADGRILWQGNPARIVNRPSAMMAMRDRIEQALDAARAGSFPE